MIALQGYEIGSAGLEPPAGARNGRKASLKIRRNPSPGILRLDPGKGFVIIEIVY